jgi:EpsI family protein
MNRNLVILAIVVAATALLVRFVPLHRDVPLRKPFGSFPLQVNGWSGKDFGFDEVILDKLKVSEYMSREYVKSPHRVGLYVGYYTAQKEGAQIHSPKHCLPGGGWRSVGETTRSESLPGFGQVRYVESVYQRGEDKQVFVYWYQMKDATVTGDYGLKLRMILNSLLYRRNDGAFIRLSAPVTGSVEDTVASLRGFMTEVLPPLRACLPE